MKLLYIQHISVYWKLNGDSSAGKRPKEPKLKVEWGPKTDDTGTLETALDSFQDFNVNSMPRCRDGIKSVKFRIPNNKNTEFMFRITYFDGTDWSAPSEIKAVSDCGPWDQNKRKIKTIFSKPLHKMTWK